MATFPDFTSYGAALAATLDDSALTRMGNAAGRAGKEAATHQIQRALGADQAMSNWRLHRATGTKVSAGYDLNRPGSVDVNMRPKGLVILSTKGRSGSGVIDTDRYSAVRTPHGPRATSSWGSSRGTGLLGKAREDMADDVPKAHAKAYETELRRRM